MMQGRVTTSAHGECVCGWVCVCVWGGGNTHRIPSPHQTQQTHTKLHVTYMHTNKLVMAPLLVLFGQLSFDSLNLSGKLRLGRVPVVGAELCELHPIWRRTRQ